ncbi:hypothetical protein RFI_38293 [Reticulomyxa filosa]|uniref:Uncharacterized protein n=1 Tax=Reticulomyxa filosa TaxID=46433 RepID=X6LCB5_RETFI|nr:hypothetical protein RFI_38293 [Reticulomyxa filosa]|eukprot:ETN99188.1 hypothetical protein RFI_38293 [Reticulomyxa filosa]
MEQNRVMVYIAQRLRKFAATKLAHCHHVQEEPKPPDNEPNKNVKILLNTMKSESDGSIFSLTFPSPRSKIVPQSIHEELTTPRFSTKEVDEEEYNKVLIRSPRNNDFCFIISKKLKTAILFLFKENTKFVIFLVHSLFELLTFFFDNV